MTNEPRIFEQTKLTKLVIVALQNAILNIQSNPVNTPSKEDLQAAGQMHNLLERIENESLDIKLNSRDF